MKTDDSGGDKHKAKNQSASHDDSRKAIEGGAKGHGKDNARLDPILQRLSRFETLSVSVQVLLLVATIAYAIVSCKQWGAMKDATRAGNRAWIVVKEITQGFTLLPNTNQTVEIVFENIGHAPAVGLSQFAMPLVSTAPPGDWEQGNGIKPLADVGPTERHAIPIRVGPINEQSLGRILRGEFKLFVFGRFDYFDGFGKPGSTKFCFSWEPPPAPGSFLACTNGNSLR